MTSGPSELELGDGHRGAKRGKKRIGPRRREHPDERISADLGVSDNIALELDVERQPGRKGGEKRPYSHLQAVEIQAIRVGSTLRQWATEGSSARHPLPSMPKRALSAPWQWWPVRLDPGIGPPVSFKKVTVEKEHRFFSRILDFRHRCERKKPLLEP